MKNAHERFGKLVYRRRTEKTATNLRVFLDAFVGEERGKAHLVSVVGGDVEIGALAAAFANGDSFTVEDPYGAESIVSLGEKPLCFRGSVVVPGRKRPLRHLVSCSQELADMTSDGKLLLISDDHLFIWSSLVRHYGLRFVLFIVTASQIPPRAPRNPTCCASAPALYGWVCSCFRSC